MKRYIYCIIILLVCVENSMAGNGSDTNGTVQSSLTPAEKRKFDYFFLEAVRQKQAGKYSEAFAGFSHALSIDSVSPVALYEISNYYLYLNQPYLAIESLKKAVRYNDRFEYKIALANLTRELGLYEESVGLYEELSASYPEKAELNFYLSEIYEQLGEIDKAINALDLLENNLGMNENLSLQKYRLYTMTDRSEAAFNELDKLSEKYPLDAKYPIIIGDLYLEQNNPEKALVYYKRAYAIDPKSPYYVVSMANYYEYTGDDEAAGKEIDTALRNPELDVEIKLSILTRYIQGLNRSKKDIEPTNALFETLISQHPQEKELNLMYGNLLLFQNKVEDAKFQFQVVTEASPENIVAWKQLLNIALKENKPDDCIAICNKALEQFPEDPEFYFYKGIAFSIKEDYNQALESYLQGIAFVPQENPALLSDFYGQIGDTYHQLKKKEEAYEAYEKALSFNDKNIGVLNNYAYFLSLDKKELAKAERMSSQTVKMQPDNSTYLDTYAWIFFVRENYTLAKFYIESAMAKDGDKSAEIVDHYGDILFMTGDKENAVIQWKKALELGKDTEILRKKINDQQYYEEESPE